MARQLFFVALGLMAIVSAGAAPPEGPIDCSKIDEMLEDIGQAQSVSTLSEKYPIVSTAEEWTKRCVEAQDAIKTLKRINRECFKDLTQQVVSAMARTRGAMLEMSCKPDTQEFKDTVGVAKCIKDNSLAEMMATEKKIVAMSQAILDMSYPNEAARTLRSCCTVDLARKMMTDTVEAKCAQWDKVINEHADSYTSEAMGLICGSIDKSACAKLEPLKLDGVQAKSMSYLLPAVKAVKMMDHA